MNARLSRIVIHIKQFINDLVLVIFLGICRMDVWQ